MVDWSDDPRFSEDDGWPATFRLVDAVSALVNRMVPRRQRSLIHQCVLEGMPYLEITSGEPLGFDVVALARRAYRQVARLAPSARVFLAFGEARPDDLGNAPNLSAAIREARRRVGPGDAVTIDRTRYPATYLVAWKAPLAADIRASIEAARGKFPPGLYLHETAAERCEVIHPALPVVRDPEAEYFAKIA